MSVRRFLRENGLSLAFGTGFLLALCGQAVAGHADFNNALVTDGMAPIGRGAYPTSSDFAVDVTENWQSEYLQFFLYIFVTVWLLQRGSPESKELDRAGPESDEDQLVGEHAPADAPRWARAGCWRQAVYSRSRTATARPPGPGQLGPVPHRRRLLEPHLPELAVRAAGGGLDGRPVDLPAPARLPRVQAGRRRPHRDGRGGLTGPGVVAALREVGVDASVDRIARPWGSRTPYGRDEAWPERVDTCLAEGVDAGSVQRWVRAASILHSDGDAMDIAVADGRMVGVRGRAQDRVNRGRLEPKDLFAWQANASPDRRTRPLVREDGHLVECDWPTAMDRIVNRSRDLLQERGLGAIGFYSRARTGR